LLEADEAHCNWDIADQTDEDLHLFQDSLREMRYAMRQLGLIERRRPVPVAPIPVVVETWPPSLSNCRRVFGSVKRKLSNRKPLSL
jgi:hypothetical protein